jgi:signal transduction histidine kinase
MYLCSFHMRRARRPRDRSNMWGLLNKGMLFALCMAVHAGHGLGPYAVVAAIVSVIGAASCEYLAESRLKAAVTCLLSAAAVWHFPLLYYMPLVFYDGWRGRPHWTTAVMLLPLAARFAQPDIASFLLVIIGCALAVIMKQQAMALQERRRENVALRDSAAELSSSLMRRNKALMEGQDDQINLAMLSERSRIAREMHDTVGHVLSSAILQTGALMALSSDEGQKPHLKELHATLAGGMEEVRRAIHGLHDDSIDLLSQLEGLAKGFAGAKVVIDFDVSHEMEKPVQYAFIAIAKEALSNVARHSNATRVDISVQEHPAFYQLIISDNGTNLPKTIKEGMGLNNIRDRVEQVGGIVTISFERGFEIFISVQKEENL